MQMLKQKGNLDSDYLHKALLEIIFTMSKSTLENS